MLKNILKLLISKAAGRVSDTAARNNARRDSSGAVDSPTVRRLDEIRPLVPILAPGSPIAGVLTPQLVAAMRASADYSDVAAFFNNYPPRSFMSDYSRAALFMLIRAMRPKVVAEIGTLFAGTSEVIARALWENGMGVIHTTDPHGGDRCPSIINSWPDELRRIICFHPLNSMEFFVELEHKHVELDFVLIDGNHDFEFALFDLQMAAKLLRPGGVVVMDNAEQTGPYQAARAFLGSNPAWHELGSAIDSFDPSKPFDEDRESIPDTSFILLQAPAHFILGSVPKSWGQISISEPGTSGISLAAAAQRTGGLLHYQAIFRAFGDENRDVVELKSLGSVRLDLDGPATTLSYSFGEPLTSDMQLRYAGVKFTFEFEVAWQADPGAPPLALTSIPQPLALPA